jgi:pimeloyl-ACP methyl ester carboxylesterase
LPPRGYGKSERGKVPLSHRQFALDAWAVIENAFKDDEKLDVLGFSEGTITAYLLVSAHPERFDKLIAIGGSKARTTRHWRPLKPIL